MRPDLLTTLKVPGYRWLLLNNFGMSSAWTAELLATGWLVLQLTDSPFWLGLVAGVRGLTQLVFSVIGGTLADRRDLRRLLMRNQRYSFLLSILLALLVLTGTIQVWSVLVVQVGFGLLQAMNGPANQVLLYETVGPSRLLSARALGFLVMSVTRIVSALGGGLVIDRIGIGPAYVFVAAGYLLGSIALIPLPFAAAARPAGTAFRSLVEGLRYALRTERIRELLFLSLTTEAFGFSHMQMVPVMARDVLHVGADGLGYLTAASGAGQLAAMLLLANSGDPRRKDAILLGSAFGYGASIFAFALSPAFGLSILLCTLIGATAGTYDSTIATVIQTVVHGDMRGRIVGLYTATWGSNQLGSFGLGALASVIGAPAAIAGFAAVECLSALRLVSKRSLFDPRTTSGEAATPLVVPASIAGPPI